MKRANIVTYDVYVSNFNKSQSNDIIEKKVSKHFTQYGETKGIFVRDNNQGKFGVVKYLSEPDADRAVSESNGILLDGLPILVRRMERKANKLSGGCSGGAGVAVTGGSWGAAKDTAVKTQLGKNPDIVPAVEPTGSASPGPEGETSSPGPLRNNRIPGSVSMLVTYVETPTLYWCQELNETVQHDVENVRVRLAEVCPNAPRLQKRPEMGKIYGAMFSEDGDWYRCQLKNTQPAGNPERVRIQYVDYGNSEEIWFKEMVELPVDIASLKPLAQKIMLHNTRYLQGGIEKEARMYLERILFNQVTTICPTFRLSDGTGQFAQVFTETTGNLNQHLIDKGFAVVKPPKQPQQQQQPFQSAPPLKNDAASPLPVHLGDGGGYSSGGSWGIGDSGDAGCFPDVAGLNHRAKSDGMGGRQVLGEPDPMRNPAARFGVPTPGHGSMGKVGGGGEKTTLLGDPPSVHGPSLLQAPGPAFSDLKIDLHNKQRALEKAGAELAAERIKIKNLQQEFQGLVTRMEENNIVNQMKVVVKLVEKVRQLRTQFSWEQPSALDEALELACSEHRMTEDSVSSLPPLMATLASYRSLQKEICSQVNTQAYEEKLTERDALRKTLHQQLSECITEMEGLPFTDRAQSITQCTEKLMKNYESYFSLPVEPFPDFSAAVTQYKELKAKKQNDFEQAQQRSDQQQQLVQSQLTAIGKSLALTAEEQEDDCDLDILKQMKLYRVCLQQEIAVRNVEDSKEGSLLASLVKSVQQDLKGEMLGLNHLMGLQQEFCSLRDSMAPWLESRPSMDALIDNRQSLRSLKSKLRHKLADKHDAEENEEGEALEEIQKEVEDIQAEIHNALMVEEKQLGELAGLVDKHFPEFLTLHPDSGLDLQLEYKGIVKSHYEISHFNLTQIPGANGRLFFSKFASKDIIIRECLLSDGHHGGQKEFLAQLKTYTDISHPALLPPSTVFFDKKNRHAYVIVEKGEGDVLANCVQYGTIDQGDGVGVVRSVVEALSALHSRKILHGEVNPFSILRYPDGTATLIPPDLSCSPIDRAKNKFTTASGLSFMAPELSSMPSGCDATGVVDMYSVGILILYLSCGLEGVPLTADGSLDVSKLQLEASACGLVKNLLSQQPPLRPAAELVLVSNYLRQMSPHDASADMMRSQPSAAAVSLAMCSTIPTFPALTNPMQHPVVTTSLPVMPPINLQQPPPPLPSPYPCVQQEMPFSSSAQIPSTADSLSRFSTPPPVDSFSALSMADTPSFVDPAASSNPGHTQSPFPGAASGGDQGYDAPRGSFEAGSGAYLPSMSGGFEEAALRQEQQENESRGPMATFGATPEPAAFAMADQGHFEIGTFSIQDVNGAVGDSSGKGRKITRQLSADEEEKGQGEEDWPVSDSGSGD
ncbi:serine/threonine-protein kinase 31-like isoform X2 [Babylonia areolata]|uniref:serine/threonine-protein kinase 31-like isoform X2 n=1 Tax=Babylonia areolata TaxID=304850 RepID=UPI003FD01EE3